MSRYAAATSVPVEHSRMELERILIRYGCHAFVSGWDPHGAMAQFEFKGRSVILRVPYPDDKQGRWNEQKLQQAKRQRWRVLLLLVKAQLEAVECGLATFEEAFLPYMVLKDGQTVAQLMVPQLPPAREVPKLKAVNP